MHISEMPTTLVVAVMNISPSVLNGVGRGRNEVREAPSKIINGYSNPSCIQIFTHQYHRSITRIDYNESHPFCFASFPVSHGCHQAALCVVVTAAVPFTCKLVFLDLVHTPFCHFVGGENNKSLFKQCLCLSPFNPNSQKGIARILVQDVINIVNHYQNFRPYSFVLLFS